MKKIYEADPWLMPYKDAIDARHEHIWQTLKHIAGDGLLKDAVNNHMYYGLHRCADGSWVFREFAPNANKIYLIGTASCTSCTSNGPAAGESACPPMPPA